MDSRSFNTQLAAKTELSAKEAASLSDQLVATLCDTLSSLDNIAIPGFGTFSATKHEEHISTDNERGVAMLIPPSITINFTPGAQLRKNISSNK